jgi:hypothetical protein
MNAAEHIVDCYYRVVKKCFTINDAKVIGGVNRQLDVLAVNLTSGDQYHVESSVTHRTGWAPKPEQLEKIFKKKFLGLPGKREGSKTDFARGIDYKKNILETYKAYGLNPQKIQRIFVCWILHPKTPGEEFLKDFERNNEMKITVISFRDTILPELYEAVGTANYDDEVLRAIGFFKERERQAPD